jgi:hypothetical protein
MTSNIRSRLGRLEAANDTGLPLALWRREHESEADLLARWRAAHPGQPDPIVNVIRRTIVAPPRWLAEAARATAERIATGDSDR